MKTLTKKIHIFSDKKSTGKAAAKSIENCIVKLQRSQPEIRMIFAAAPSQDSMLSSLVKSKLIVWEKITAFNMDEYIGLKNGAKELFASYLEENLFSKVNIKHKHLINPNNTTTSEISRYSKLLNEAPIDIVCLGIGENGHIAFNDPPVADFNDPEIIKPVILDEKCRIQQVNDGCFPSLDKVPQKALTLTIPTILKANHLFCVVLGDKKSEAVKNTIHGPINTSCPASILRTHSNCNYFFDEKASQKLQF